jgi:hypothetical protein
MTMGHIDPGGQSSSTEVEQNYDEEEGVCKAPEQFESKAAQSCPLAEPPRKRKREECQATSLVISKKLSNKSGVRKIEIKRGGPGHSDDPSNSPPPRLEIVSGCFDDTWLQDLIAKKPATVECKAVILAGPCERGESGPGSGQSDGQSVRGHKDSTYDVPFAVDSRSDTELKFKASAQGHLIPWWAEPRIYQVCFNTCSDSFVGEVAVYPDVEFGIGFEYKRQEQTSTDFENTVKVTDVRKVALPERKPTGNKKKKRKKKGKADPKSLTPREVKYEATFVESEVTETKITKNLSMFGMLKIAGMEVNYKNCYHSYLSKVKKVTEIADGVLEVIKKFNAADDEATVGKEMEQKENASRKAAHTTTKREATQPRRTKQTFIWPSVQYKLSGLWIELEDSHQCACATRFALAFKPLIGMSYTWDLTPMVLRAFGAITGGSSLAVAEVWTRLQAWLEKRGIDAFRVELIIEGTLEGEVLVDIASGSDWNATAPLDFNLKGRIEATLAKMQIDKKMLGLRVQGDIDIGIKGETGFRFRAEFMTEGENGVYGSVEWTGIKVTIALKWRSCVSTTECTPTKDKEYPEELSWTFAGIKSDRHLIMSFEPRGEEQVAPAATSGAQAPISDMQPPPTIRAGR